MIKKIIKKEEVSTSRRDAEEYLKSVDEMVVKVIKDNLDVDILNNVLVSTDDENIKYAMEMFKVYNSAKEYILKQADREDLMMKMISNMNDEIRENNVVLDEILHLLKDKKKAE